jgi:hypothetical protein
MRKEKRQRLPKPYEMSAKGSIPKLCARKKASHLLGKADSVTFFKNLSNSFLKKNLPLSNLLKNLSNC